MDIPALRDFLFMGCLILSVVLLEPPMGFPAQGASQLKNDTLLIVFDKPLQDPAQQLFKRYASIKGDIEETLRWKITFRPKVILMGNHNTFQRLAPSRLVVAYARPEKALIVIDYTKITRKPFSLESVMKHELCHLLLHDRIRTPNLPRWLDEGVAQWVSNGIAEVLIQQRHSLLDEAIVSGRYLPMKSLIFTFPEDKRSLHLAYEESRRFVEYIVRRHGADGLLSILNRLEAGADLDAAVLRGLSVTFMDLENDWYQSLQRHSNWLAFLSNHLYEILFFVSALLLIVGFAKRIIRQRHYFQEEAEGEPGNFHGH
jgi:hypothetical protein